METVEHSSKLRPELIMYNSFRVNFGLESRLVKSIVDQMTMNWTRLLQQLFFGINYLRTKRNFEWADFGVVVKNCDKICLFVSGRD